MLGLAIVGVIVGSMGAGVTITARAVKRNDLTLVGAALSAIGIVLAVVVILNA